MSSNENKNATAAKEPVMVTLEAGKQVEARTLKASDHVKAFDPVIIVITMLASCLGAIIGLELMTRVGVNQNTSIIGALIAVVLSMIPARYSAALRTFMHRTSFRRPFPARPTPPQTR